MRKSKVVEQKDADFTDVTVCLACEMIQLRKDTKFSTETDEKLEIEHTHKRVHVKDPVKCVDLRESGDIEREASVREDNPKHG